MAFADLHRQGRFLYRGWCGRDKAALVRAVGVGPVRDVAEALVRRHARHIDDPLREAARWLVEQIAEASQVGVDELVQRDEIACLTELLSKAEGAEDRCTTVEHVGKDPDGPKRRLRLSTRAVESMSKDPRVAVRYAYGLDPDSARSGRPPALVSQTANDDPFVAVVRSDDDRELESVRPGVEWVDVAEIERRIARDLEVFARGAERAQVIELPPFDPRDPSGSLDRAADVLFAAGVASTDISRTAG